MTFMDCVIPPQVTATSEGQRDDQVGAHALVLGTRSQRAVRSRYRV